jgi:peroxidase
MVYGSDPVRAAALRTFQGGKLKTSANGQLLPTNRAGLPNAGALGLGNQLFLAGDVRANEQLNLTAVHTLFVREHNRLATRIHNLYPHLNDEEIYQLARRIVGAEMQIITYEEYLPAIFGYDLAPRAEDAVYDPNVYATITNSFAHAVFRFGHSQINETTLLVSNSGQTVGSLFIRDAFFNPNFLKNDPANIARMLKGLASQLGQENDLLLVDGIRNSLFGPRGAGGLDLAALDIQRGRDHGLPDYNTLRAAYGLPRVTSFAEISSDPQIQAQLQQLFGTVDNIDAFVGALAEDHLPGASAGEFILAVVGDQFERLRDGDRFFYTNDTLLQSEAVRQIINLDNVTLSRIIKWNTGITNLQDNVFFDRSVLIIEAPPAGSNVTLVAALGVVGVVNNQTGQVLALRSLASVSQVILVGSNTAADVFTVAIAGANGGLEGGVVLYAGNSTGDVLNVIGTFGQDTITVGANSLSANGNTIAYSGLERMLVVTLTGNDQVFIDPDVELEVEVW